MELALAIAAMEGHTPAAMFRVVISALKKERPRTRFDDTDRAFWVALRASWPGWGEPLTCRQAFWRWKSLFFPKGFDTELPVSVIFGPCGPDLAFR